MTEIEPGTLFTTRQTAHALGINYAQLIYMIRNGEAFPAYQLPGTKGAYMWTRTEIERLLAAGQNARGFRRRRVRTKYQMNGLQPVPPRPRRRRLPPPPA